MDRPVRRYPMPGSAPATINHYACWLAKTARPAGINRQSRGSSRVGLTVSIRDGQSRQRPEWGRPCRVEASWPPSTHPPVASADVRHGYHACKLGAEQRYTVGRQLYRWELAAVMVKRTAQQSFASGCGNVAAIKISPRIGLSPTCLSAGSLVRFQVGAPNTAPAYASTDALSSAGVFLSFCQRRENDHCAASCCSIA